MFESIHEENEMREREDKRRDRSMLESRHFPTVPGVAIANKAGLLCKDENDEQYEKDMHVLSSFQQMAVGCSLEMSLSCYADKELNGDQKEALAWIFKATRAWVRTYSIIITFNRLDNKRTGNRDFAESLKTILEAIPEADETYTSDNPTGKKIKQLIVKITAETSDDNNDEIVSDQ